MSEEVFDNLSSKKHLAISPRELMLKYLRYLPWVIVSVALMLLLAYLKLRYETPLYKASGKLLVKKNSNPYSKGNDKFDDIFMMQGSTNTLNDEMEIIRSRSMASRVVKLLALQKQYYSKGNIRTSLVHESDMPFLCELKDIKDSTSGFSYLFNIIDDSYFTINVSPTRYYYNQVVDLGNIKIKVTKTGKSIKAFGSNEFIVSWSTIDNLAAGLSSSVGVAPTGDYNSNVLNIAYISENVKLATDIVNGFMTEYQKSGLEDKQQIAKNTLAFIDDQLVAVKGDLGNVERSLQLFQEQNRVFKPDMESELFTGEIAESNRQLMENGQRLKVVEYLSKYVSDKKNPYRMVTSTLGLEEPALMGQIIEFNKLQLERETSIKTTTEFNPLIKNLETGIEKLRTDIQETLGNIGNTYKMVLSDINKKNIEASEQIRKLPGKQKQLLEVTRQQKILAELYSFLLQKRLETSISSASNISNIKVLEPASVSGGPVSPNRKGRYTVFFIIGLAIPIAIIFLLEYLNDKVKGKVDIERITNAPVLGEVGHAEESGALVVTKNTRHFIAEQFRIIRSNLQYILPKTDRSVMMVTSSFSGEGKSFVSTNLGAVLAISGKKTVILEFDIRKPKIMEGLGLNERKGITNYVVGNLSISEIIYQVPGQENLFVIPCGPVPPNPSEMLLNEKIGVLFTDLKKLFDVVIIDTAPVGLVSDAITLGQYADACMYIVRHNYTFKKQVQLIDELYNLKKLPHLSIIINDINAKAGYGSYYGYGNYGYGYGYGYGNGSDYFEGKALRKPSFIKRIKQLFS
jgi:tyrosine-protein kinase Etk/Wzc